MILGKVIRIGAKLKVEDANLLIQEAIQRIVVEIPPQQTLTHIEVSQVAFLEKYIQVILLVRTQ